MATDEAISVHEAIEAWTVGGPWAAAMDDRLDRIRLDYLADLVVLDADPYDVPVHEIGQVRVRGTIFDSKVVRL